MHGSPSRRAVATLRGATLAAVIAVAIGACSGGASTAPSAPETSPTTPPGVLVLNRAPDDTACDTIGIDYTVVHFHVVLTASPQIWADSDTGASLTIRWDSTFQAGTGAEPSVVDASGVVVLEDGDSLDIPGGAYPELKGHFVCTGPSELIILDQAPA